MRRRRMSSRAAARRELVLLVVVAQSLSSLACSQPDATDDVPAPAGEHPTLASCDVVPTELQATGGGEGVAEPVEITLWHSERTEPWRMLAELVDEFDRAHPSITVHIEDVGGGREGVLDHWRATAPPNRPALAIMAEDATRLLADSGQTVAPGSCLAEAVPGLLPVVEAAWSVNGVVQAVPYAVSTPVLIYNRRMFRDAGLDPDDPPASLADLRTTAQQLVESGAVPVGLLFDVGEDGAPTWFVEQWNAQAGALSLEPDNGRDGVAEAAVWPDGAAVDHLAWLQAMVADGLAASVRPNRSGLDDLVAVFDSPPRGAMTLHTSGSLVELSDALDAAGFTPSDLGVAPLPGPGQGSLPGGAAIWLAAGRSVAETHAAWSLVAFLASPAVQSRWGAATGYVPISRRSVGTEPLRSVYAQRPYLEVAYRVLVGQGTSVAELGMSAGPEPEIQRILADAVEAVADGDDPAPALRDAASDTEGLLLAYARGLAPISDSGSSPR